MVIYRGVGEARRGEGTAKRVRKMLRWERIAVNKSEILCGREGRVSDFEETYAL